MTPDEFLARGGYVDSPGDMQQSPVTPLYRDDFRAVIEAVSEVAAMPVKDLLASQRGDHERAIWRGAALLIFSDRHPKIRSRRLADLIGMEASSARHAMSRARARLETDEELASLVQRARTLLGG